MILDNLSVNKVSKTKMFRMATSAIALAMVFGPNLSNAVPANAPIRAEAVVQQFNLTAKNKDFKFSKMEKKNDSVIFYNVKTTNGVSASKMIVDNQEETGRVRVTMEGVGAESGSSTFNGDKIIFVYDKLPDTKTFNGFLDLEKFSSTGDMSAENLSINIDSMPIKIEKFSVNGVVSKDKDYKFKDLHVRNLDADFLMARLKTKEIDISGINDALFKIINSQGNNVDEEWNNIGLDTFRIAGLEVSSDAINNNSKEGKTSFDGLKLGLFEVGGLEKNVLKHFAFNGFETGGLNKGSPIKIKVGEYSFDNLNLLYIKSIIGSLKDSDKSELGEKTLAEISPLGPYGMLVSKARFADILVLADGLKFSLDDMNYVPTFNAQNIITAISMPKATVDISVADKEQKTGKEFGEFLADMGLKSFNLSLAGDGKYNPENGLVTYENNYLRAENIGEVGYQGTIGGFENFMKNTKIKDLAAISKQGMEDSAINQNESDKSKKIVKQELNMVDQSLKLYKDITIVDLNIGIKEFGFLNRIALSEAASKNKTTKAIRKEWADKFGKEAKNKKNSPLVRELSSVFSQFVEKGGSVNFKFTPSQPFVVTRLFDKDVTSKEAGLEIKLGN